MPMVRIIQPYQRLRPRGGVSPVVRIIQPDQS